MAQFLHLGHAAFNIDEIAGARPGPTDNVTRVFLRNGNMTFVEVAFGDFVDALQGVQMSEFYVVTLPEALKNAQK